ncbi:MAG: hypothetical protein QNJ16_18820 [Rhodobacter sp.]|nr:hypothetical protein [Rhodobacter sp.]
MKDKMPAIAIMIAKKAAKAKEGEKDDEKNKVRDGIAGEISSALEKKSGSDLLKIIENICDARYKAKE